VAQLNNRVSNWGQPFKAGYPGAVQGDQHYGVGGPPGVGKKVITVASYLAEATLPNGNTALGTLSSYSSEGPTQDERQKPDITAPGESVLSAVNSHDPSPGLVQETVEFNGTTYSFVRYSATSMFCSGNSWHCGFDAASQPISYGRRHQRNASCFCALGQEHRRDWSEW